MRPTTATPRTPRSSPSPTCRSPRTTATAAPTTSSWSPARTDPYTSRSPTAARPTPRAWSSPTPSRPASPSSAPRPAAVRRPASVTCTLGPSPPARRPPSASASRRCRRPRRDDPDQQASISRRRPTRTMRPTTATTEDTGSSPSPTVDHQGLRRRHADDLVVVAGQDSITYSLWSTNGGPSDGPAGVVVTDTLPAGVTFVGASADCSEAAGGVRPAPSAPSPPARRPPSASASASMPTSSTGRP